jgi:hypothetical protein
MDSQTALLIALALLTAAGICVGVAGVALFRRMGTAEAPGSTDGEDAGPAEPAEEP